MSPTTFASKPAPEVARITCRQPRATTAGLVSPVTLVPCSSEVYTTDARRVGGVDQHGVDDDRDWQQGESVADDDATSTEVIPAFELNPM